MTGQKHIAFFNIPALGHVYPTLPVVSELVRRGHRVSYAAVKDRDPLISKTGATLVPYGSTRPNDADPSYAAPVGEEYIAGTLLSFLIEGMEEPLRASRMRSLRGHLARGGTVADVIEQHARILDRVRARDARGAAAAMRAHLAQTERDLRAAFAVPDGP